MISYPCFVRSTARRRFLPGLLAAGFLSLLTAPSGPTALRAGEEKPIVALPLTRPDAATVKRLNEALSGAGLPALPGGALSEEGAWVGLMLGEDAARSQRALLPPPPAPATPGSDLREPLSEEAAATLLKGVRSERGREKLVAETRGLSPHQIEELREERRLGFADILSLPTATLRRAIFEIEREAGDHPEEFMRWRNRFLVDETGAVDPAAIERARQQALALPLNPRRLPVDTAAAAARSRPVNAAAAADPSQNIGPASWTWKGPGNIGGRIRAMVVHPTQTNRMWIGSVGGGIWYSSNSGVSWAPVNDFMGNLAVSTLALDPTNPSVMYAGTGEGFYNGDAIRGAGIYKSTDGGVSWTQLASTANGNFAYVNRLAVAPDASAVLAVTAGGIFRSTDGGANWAKTLTPSATLGDVEFHPTDNTRAVASGYGAQLYYSTNGGAAWTAASGRPSGGTGYSGGRVEVRYAKSSPGTLYASFDFGSASQLFKSTDGGASYAKVFDSATAGTAHWLSGQGWYANALWVSPADPNVVVAGGLDIWRSTDGGASFTQISDWRYSPNSAHADHHGIFPDPGFNGTTNKTVYFTDDGGIYKAADVSTTGTGTGKTGGWQELNNQLGITQFYGAGVVPSTGTIIAGAQDNGTLVYKPANGTENWSATFGGDGGYCAADPGNGYLYGEYVFLQIHRSTNNGASSSYVYNGITDANNGNNAEFIAPFILDPNNPSTLLAGGLSLWRSADAHAATVSWSAVKASDGNTITAIAVAPGNSNIIWVGHGNGNVYKTTNGTAASPTWTQVDNNATALPNRRVTRIAVDADNNNRVFVTFGGYTSGNVWGTTDGGTTWANRTGTLPSAPVYAFLVLPGSGGQTLYAGTDVGIFASDDGGATWGGTNIGPTLASVQELLLMGSNTLVTVTHGRGVFTAPTAAGPPSLTISPNGIAVSTDPIPFTFTFSSGVTGFTASDVNITNGTAGAFTGSGAAYTLNVSPTVASGTVSVSVPAGAAQDATTGAQSLAASASVSVNIPAPTLAILPTLTVTNASPVAFTFNFNEAVTGFTLSDITVDAGVPGTLTGPTVFADGTNLYRLDVTPVGNPANVSLSVPASAAQDRFSRATPAASATVVYDRSSPFLYATAFDGSAAPAGWTTAGSANVWQWGTPTSGPNADHTGSGGKLYGTVLAGNYPDSADTYLVTPGFDLPPAGGQPYRLRFWMWMNAESGYDGGNLEISVDNAAYSVVPASALSVPYNQTGITSMPGGLGWSSTTYAAWTRVRANLPAYAGHNVRFRFHFTSDSNTNFAGWYIDDLALEQDPVVTLAATDPVAADGGNAGAFTFNLFPNAPGPLTLGYSVGGAAVNGTDYTVLGGTVPVPAGAGTATVPVTAINRNGARPRTAAVVLAIANGADYTIGSPNTATVYVAGETGFDAWRAGRFTDAEFVNDAVSGPAADPDHDGVPNLLEYALGLDPKHGDAAGLPVPVIRDVNNGRYLTMTVVRSQANTDVTYTAQVSADLQTWDGSAAAVETTVQANTPSAGVDTVTFRDLTPLSPGNVSGRFLRLVVGRN